MTSRNGQHALALARQAAGTAGYVGASDDTRNRAALVVDHLSKDFGSRAAFSDVSFMVGYGEVFGFLGPNGAGKSAPPLWHLISADLRELS